MEMTENVQTDESAAFEALLARYEAMSARMRQGGGEKAQQKQREKGKMTVRERVAALIDEGSEFFEIGLFAGEGMYAEYGGCPGGGVVVGLGQVSGRQCVIVANDATVKAGAWFPITGKKNLRAQEIAIENNLPILYLVDSAGIFLPLQDDIFADKEHFGRIFRNNAQMSAAGIPQIAAIMGSCVAGGAYLPIMSDESMIVEGTGSIFLAGSYLVKAAIGETVDNETLGGATTQTALSGVVDYKMPDDATCIKKIRQLVSNLPYPDYQHFVRHEVKLPLRKAEEVYDIVPENRAKQYDTHQLLECLFDEGSMLEYKADYGKSIVTAYGNIDGWAVGVVANQRMVIKSQRGEMQFGGVIYSDSADKAARFIMTCNQKKLPLVFLHDVTGFMVGSRSEHGGIIKDGAKMVNAMANSVVPKFTVVVGNSYGAGNYAMCGKAYDPRLMLAWPTARIAVMGGEQAAKTLLQIQVASLKGQGQVITPEDESTLLNTITDRYQAQTLPEYAAARLWVDAIIEPHKTRDWLSAGIQAANHKRITESYKTGVIQT